jgi:phosphatidylinositol N-acetylglucosaminyltransferase subunit C
VLKQFDFFCSRGYQKSYRIITSISRYGLQRLESILKEMTSWMRYLHTHQQFPDNYVDASFLANLATTKDLEAASAFQVAQGAAVFVEQISGTILLLCCYGLLQSGLPYFSFIAFADASCCLLLAGSILILRYIQCRLSSSSSSSSSSAAGTTRSPVQWAQAIRFCCVVLLSLLALSPILKTLTQSYCNDSLWTLTGLLLLVHLLTHDYSFQLGPRRVPGVLSMNSAMSASILLASRLYSPTHAFACISLAVQIFALLPIFRDHIRSQSDTAHGLLVVLTIFITASALSLFSSSLVYLYFLGTFFTLFICPVFFSHASKQKLNLKGYWDIPIVSGNSN